jgi:hypothetical protein
VERDCEPEVDWITAELARSRATERAPVQVRARLQALIDAAPRRRTAPARAFVSLLSDRRRGAAPRQARRPLVGAFALAGALVVALLLTLSAGGRPGPTVLAAAAALPRASAWPASAARAAAPPRALYRSFAGVDLPAALARPGWRTTGTLTVRVAGRTLEVSGYRAGPVTVTYAVAAGPVLRGQTAGYSSFRVSGRTAVSWREAGHSCLLLSRRLSPARLLAIARS